LKSVSKSRSESEPGSWAFVLRQSVLTQPPLESGVLEIRRGDRKTLVVRDGTNREVLIHFEQPRVNIDRSSSGEIGRGRNLDFGG